MPDPAPPVPARAKRVVLVDDSTAYAASWRAIFADRYGDRVAFEAYQDPVAALAKLGPDVDLLLVDLEMPVLDGRSVARLAKERGISEKRIVIVSGHDADELHRLFPKGACLAVINKTEAQQQSAFLMILDSVVFRH
ncbi:MAG: response regulator [Thermoanaerobaculia bacterium]